MSDLIYHKILHALELTCPLFKQNLITNAFIVGSVAKGTARKNSDIDIYLINPSFQLQFKTYDIQLTPSHSLNPRTNMIIKALENNNAKHEPLKNKELNIYLSYWRYKNEIFHFMYDYESESITNSKDEHIEITRDFCEMIKHLNY